MTDDRINVSSGSSQDQAILEEVLRRTYDRAFLMRIVKAMIILGVFAVGIVGAAISGVINWLFAALLFVMFDVSPFLVMIHVVNREGIESRKEQDILFSGTTVCVDGLIQRRRDFNARQFRLDSRSSEQVRKQFPKGL